MPKAVKTKKRAWGYDFWAQKWGYLEDITLTLATSKAIGVWATDTEIPATRTVPVMTYLVGGWALPLRKMMECVSWDDDIPNIWENKIHVPNHQPVMI